MALGFARGWGESSDQHLQGVPSSAKGWLLDGNFCGVSDEVLSKSNFLLDRRLVLLI